MAWGLGPGRTIREKDLRYIACLVVALAITPAAIAADPYADAVRAAHLRFPTLPREHIETAAQTIVNNWRHKPLRSPFTDRELKGLLMLGELRERVHVLHASLPLTPVGTTRRVIVTGGNILPYGADRAPLGAPTGSS